MNDLNKMTSDDSMTDKMKSELEKAQPMWKMVWTQFLDHKLAVAGACIISLFLFIAIFAGTIQAITGLDPDSQNVRYRYLSPFSWAEINADEKEATLEKFIEKNPDVASQINHELISKEIIVGVDEEDALYELGALTVPEAMTRLEKVQSPAKSEIEKLFKDFKVFHLFGTDELGRDVFMRLVYGTRVSMGVGILVALASALIGLLIGSIAGFYGGFVDSFLMRVTDALLSLPHIPVLIVIAAIDMSKLPFLNIFVSTSNESIVKMVAILCLFSWMSVARLVRGSILSIREREFVLAARTLGAKDSTIIIRHMFPNVIAPMLVSITLGVGESILFEAALSFLGLGIMPPTPSWGNMLNNAQELIYQAPFLAILPGLLIFLTTVSFNYLGDGLQDAIDPKAIKR